MLAQSDLDGLSRVVQSGRVPDPGSDAENERRTRTRNFRRNSLDVESWINGFTNRRHRNGHPTDFRAGGAVAVAFTWTAGASLPSGAGVEYAIRVLIQGIGIAWMPHSRYNWTHSTCFMSFIEQMV